DSRRTHDRTADALGSDPRLAAARVPPAVHVVLARNRAGVRATRGESEERLAGGFDDRRSLQRFSRGARTALAVVVAAPANNRALSQERARVRVSGADGCGFAGQATDEDGVSAI